MEGAQFLTKSYPTKMRLFGFFSFLVAWLKCWRFFDKNQNILEHNLKKYSSKGNNIKVPPHTNAVQAQYAKMKHMTVSDGRCTIRKRLDVNLLQQSTKKTEVRILFSFHVAGIETFS